MLKGLGLGGIGSTNQIKDEIKQNKTSMPKKKEYSVTKIAAGLRELVKQSYMDGVEGLARDLDSLVDPEPMDTLIRDFVNFESALLLTGDVRDYQFH